jgi:hypothetical protein
MSKYYTLIGSRSTPKDVCDLLEKVAYKLNEQGWVGRSGGADGADKCLENALKDCDKKRMHIFLPWNGFYGLYMDEKNYFVKNNKKAEQIASETHPAWDRCSRGAKALHTRNVHQILGMNLDKPSKFVLCYAEPIGNKGYVKGGTATAVKIAVDSGVKVYNLYYESVRKKMGKWLTDS